MSAAPITGLVLAGGGARGAFEAGVLRFIFTELAPKLGAPVNPQIICGTSAGAINGCWVAGYGPAPAHARALSEVWQTLSVTDVFTLNTLDVLRGGGRMWKGHAGQGEGHSLLDASPIHALIGRLFPSDGIRARLSAGVLRALVLSSTEVSTGRNVLFVQTAPGHELAPLPYPIVDVRPCELGPEHVLASAAIPFLFPPVRIDGQFHLDGSLRQNTPLAPALRLGADRVLVIGVKRPFHMRSAKALAESSDEPPSATFLLGKALNALTLEPLERDLHALERYNTLFEWGRLAYGDDFLERLNEVVVPIRGAPYRPVTALHIRPRADLGQVAAQSYRARPPVANRATRYFLELIAEDEDREEADTLSYLLFDRGFTGEVERLGYEDARDREEELAAFFLGHAAESAAAPPDTPLL